MTSPTPGGLLHAADGDGRALLSAAETRWDRPVPHCPEWDAAELVRHTGAILAWMAAVVSSGQRVARRTLAPAPDDPAELAEWYLANLDRTVNFLRSADPEVETWTFSPAGDRRVAWWQRRLAVEIAIHRWDVEDAVATGGGPPAAPLDADVASAGAQEFMVEFLPGLLSAEAAATPGGTLHLHATDGPTQWWVDLGAGGTAVAEHRRADTTIRATRSDLLLWLTNRCTPEALDIVGRHEILDRWQQLSR